MSGQDAVLCPHCNVRTESECRNVVLRPPKHLLMSLLRMKYSSVHQRTVRVCVILPVGFAVVEALGFV